MYNKYYTVEWMIELDDQYRTDRKRFESNQDAEMEQFVFDLADKEGIIKIWKITNEEISFQVLTNR